jgi:hypothetical protein
MGSRNGRRWHGLRLLAALVALATLGVVAAGCGGGSPSAGVAQLTTTGTTTGSGGPLATGSGGSGPSTSSGAGGGSGGSAHLVFGGGNKQQALKFAQCMRSHGLPNFPDPSADGSFSFSGNPKTMAGFNTAQQACEKLLPKGKPPSPAQQAKMRQQALKFSACMRSHGFPQFPDPTFTGGGIQMRLNKSAGMDPNSPRFQQAQQACGSLLPGKVAKS